jgi:plastocyanin
MPRTRLIPVILTAGVALLAGCSSPTGVPAVTGQLSPALQLVAMEMRYEPNRVAVAAGTVTVSLRNVGVVLHDLRIEGAPQLMVSATPGATATSTWSLKKGSYRIYCSITGHRAAGMEGILEVR